MDTRVKEAIKALQNGQIIVLTDDEARENEGDFIMSAWHASTETLNFMASVGKGLICMPMSRQLTSQLDLPQMVAKNTDPHGTAFTISIDHESTTTGISAYERALTARACANAAATPLEFKRPGHMFPLEARENGVLERPGHTEATVDLMRLAGLPEVGLCCEIMGEDGHMMKMPELKELVREHQLVFLTIEELIAYRIRQEGQEE